MSEPSEQIDKKCEWGERGKKNREGIRGEGQVSAYTLDPTVRLQKSELSTPFIYQTILLFK